MLYLLLHYQFLEERGRKRDTVGLFRANGLEMIFALLTEAVAILVRIATVEVWKASFQRLFSRLGSLGMGLALNEWFYGQINGLL